MGTPLANVWNPTDFCRFENNQFCDDGDVEKIIKTCSQNVVRILLRRLRRRETYLGNRLASHHRVFLRRYLCDFHTFQPRSNNNIVTGEPIIRIYAKVTVIEKRQTKFAFYIQTH